MIRRVSMKALAIVGTLESVTFLLVRPSDMKLFVFICCLVFAGLLVNNITLLQGINAEGMACGGRIPEQFNSLRGSANKLIFDGRHKENIYNGILDWFNIVCIIFLLINGIIYAII